MATDQQIEREAWRLYEDDTKVSVVTIALRLVREGWEPVDEDREAARQFYTAYLGNAMLDPDDLPTIFLKAIKYGRAQERGL